MPVTNIKQPVVHSRLDKSNQDNSYFDSIKTSFQSVDTNFNGLLAAINQVARFMIPGPFVNDASAAAGGIGLESAYFREDGSVWVRRV
jgi:hypothetical protein